MGQSPTHWSSGWRVQAHAATSVQWCDSWRVQTRAKLLYKARSYSFRGMKKLNHSKLLLSLCAYTLILWSATLTTVLQKQLRLPNSLFLCRSLATVPSNYLQPHSSTASSPQISIFDFLSSISQAPHPTQTDHLSNKSIRLTEVTQLSTGSKTYDNTEQENWVKAYN